MSGTDIAYAVALRRCDAMSGTDLYRCYAKSGTDLAWVVLQGGRSRRGGGGWRSEGELVLRDVRMRGTAGCYGMRGTEVAYRATECVERGGGDGSRVGGGEAAGRGK
eukprot:422619-Rhodomonas_salina.2